MPFIGQQPLTGAYHKLDSITTSATATYNLQLNGGAYSPTSANHLLVSLNGVMQAPQDSFTVSGSQITFASALTSSDSIDFIMALGDVLDIGVPSDGAVNTSQLANSAVTDAKIAGMSSSKLTGALPALDGSALTNLDAPALTADGYFDGSTYFYQTTRTLSTTNANRGYVQTELLNGTLGTSATTILSITPNSTSNAWYRSYIEVSCVGHHNGVGNGMRLNRSFYFDCNNSTLSTGSLVAPADSGNYPALTFTVSGSSFVLAGSVTSNTFYGMYEVKIALPYGSGGGSPTAWTITRGTL
jgi:hypothetical protein